MAPPPPAAATTADPHYRFQHSPRTQSLTPDGAIAAASAALADHHQAATHDDHACLGDDCFVAQNDEENQALCECLLDNLLERIARRDPNQKLFLQAFEEVARDLLPVFKVQPHYIHVLETVAEPEQVHHFRVPWLDDRGRQQVNRGYRVQFSSALGPFKGGLRFHPSVDLSVVKFLGFEQCFKNSLTGLSIGGAKGGADFDPKGRSDGEILRFCQSFATALHHHIGPNIDVPAGDIGVGTREIGYMYGMYKRLTRSFEGSFTGKQPAWGGSLLRPEATGYGVVYFAEEMIRAVEGDAAAGIRGMRCAVSGSGNVAQFATEKLLELGAVVMTMSDSTGYVIAPDGGFDHVLLELVRDAKNHLRAGLRVAADASGGRLLFMDEHSSERSTPHPKRPWGSCDIDIAFPCATQNEVDSSDVRALIACGCKYVVEGANMPTTADAVHILEQAGVAFGPAKAANAGGVAVSALEMAQNSMRLQWRREEVDEKLHEIMQRIHITCAETAAEWTGDARNLRIGANIAGFLKVANSVVEQGVV